MADDIASLRAVIESYDSFCIIGHRAPDGDALGATLGLVAALRAIGRTARPYFSTPAPMDFSFLPYFDEVIPTVDGLDSSLPWVMLDSSDASYCGLTQEQCENAHTIVIDHHITNKKFGQVNLVNPDRSSTCEYLVEIITALGIPITPEIATCLLTGIVTDTAFFSNKAASAHTFATVSRLMRAGGALKTVVKRLMHEKSIASYKVLGVALQRLKIDPERGIASTYVSREDMDSLNARDDEVHGVANFLSGLESAQMVLVWKQMGPSEFRASIRTRDHLIDASKIATLLGGGGHQRAAGFTIYGRIVETDRGWVVT